MPPRPRARYAARASSARSALRSWVIDGLIAYAWANNPSAADVAMRAIAEEPPADSPNTVTLDGSPPNEAIWSRTHSKARIWSRSPQFVVPEKPSAPSR